MAVPASAASATLHTYAAAGAEGYTGATLLGWCFSMGSLIFAVFGLMYGVYASARLAGKGDLAIVGSLVFIAWALALLQLLVASIAVFVAAKDRVYWETWLLTAALLATALIAIVLAIKMPNSNS